MPVLRELLGDRVSVRVDFAGAEETIAIRRLQEGDLPRAFVALARAEKQLRLAKEEVSRRILARDRAYFANRKQPVRRRRARG